jgi:serine/threonine protein kinase
MGKVELQTEVDIKCFGERIKIEKNLGDTDSSKRYVYKVSHKGQTYILKDFKIYLEHLNPGNQESLERLKEGIEEISEVYQEYYFARVACIFNSHFVKPLLLDYSIKSAAANNEHTYMFIKIIFEDDGVPLDKIGSVNVDGVYNLMRQSADALVLLHDIGIAHFDIKPANMVYEKKDDILKVIDMGSAFGSGTRSKTTGSTVAFDGKVRSGTLNTLQTLKKTEVGFA